MTFLWVSFLIFFFYHDRLILSKQADSPTALGKMLRSVSKELTAGHCSWVLVEPSRLVAGFWESGCLAVWVLGLDKSEAVVEEGRTSSLHRLSCLSALRA